ncbi:hypothetical protein RIF29_19156 [Crotalaria pallida]|uniref:Uncharacterized protein n=1 Tax=Crotalaria pallida TaxID=3830 RepID=A0AAN9I596_CROPI
MEKENDRHHYHHHRELTFLSSNDSIRRNTTDPPIKEMDFFPSSNNSASHNNNNNNNGTSDDHQDQDHVGSSSTLLLDQPINTGLNLTFASAGMSRPPNGENSQTEMIKLESELRRLHEENSMLKNTLDQISKSYSQLQAQLFIALQNQKLHQVDLCISILISNI